MGRKRVAQKIPKTKTFTGCFTCRQRSVKCDTTHPSCLRCQKAGLECEGYGLRLHWLSSGASSAPFNIKRSAQSLVNLPRWSYTSEEVDQFLDNVDDDLSSNGPNPFVVFELGHAQKETRAATQHFDEGFFPSPSTQNSPLVNWLGTVQSSLEDASGTSTYLTGDTHDNHTRWLIDENPHSWDTLVCVSDQQSPDNSSQDEGEWYGRLSTTMSNSLVSLQAISGHLLHNYIDNVTNLLQPIPRLANYYSAMYVPSAMVGSSSANSGSTYVHNTFSNIAIFYAILATSAFNLSTSDESGYLDAIARRFKGEAFNFLRRGVEQAQRSTPVKRQDTQLTSNRYRDAMAAMLTLVTADVMEGRMSEYWIHLEGINNLYKLLSNKERPFIFTKQQITIASFLRTLSATTLADPPPRTWSEDDDVLFNDALSIMFPDHRTLEHIYGITPTLTTYMAQINALSQIMSGFLSRNEPFSERLTTLCMNLHQSLYSWSLDQEELSSLEDATPDVKQIGYLHIGAFAYALKVHFHTRLTPCSDEELADQVRTVATFLNEIEDIKSHLDISSANADKMWASLTWPGFIASCEAGPYARRPWYAWWQSMLTYRIGNIAPLWQIVQDAWAMRDAGGADVPAWAPVLRQSGQRILAV